MVQPTDAGQAHDFTVPFDGSMLGRVLRQGEMRPTVGPTVVIVRDVGREDSPKVVLPEHDDVIETLPTNRTDQGSTYGFCQGERGAVTTCSMPMFFTQPRNTAP